MLQAFFKSFGAVTVATSPRFGAIFMSAVFAIMRVFDAQQFKKAFPIRPFFSKGRGTKTGLNPKSNTVHANARVLEVVNVFVAGYRAASERTIGDGLQQLRFPAGFNASFDEITHMSVEICDTP
jgi:hypothetical protein